MSHELTNLLPSDRQRGISREYYLRLATVTVFMLTIVVVIGTLLLAPSLLYLHGETQTRQAEVDRMNETLATPSGQNATAQLSALTASATYLTRLASTTTATAALSGILDAPHEGIVLNSLTYTPPSTGTPGSVTLSGTASTRETLRTYVSALSALPFVSNADLPISAYAKETDIPFDITLTGTLAPSS